MPHRSSLLFACVAVLAVAAASSSPFAQTPSAQAPASRVTAITGATLIDGTGQFVMPGFFDTNVHLSPYGGVNDRYETLVRYNWRQAEIVLEAHSCS